MYGFRYANWELHYRDELDYEAGTLIVPTGNERQCVHVGNEIFFVGEVAQHKLYNVAVVINRIVYWERITNDGDFSYYQFDYQVVGWCSENGFSVDHPLYGFQSNGTADLFEPLPCEYTGEIPI